MNLSMAKYTVELRTLMNNEDVKPLLDLALSTYPLYSTEKDIKLIPTRAELNTKLLNHYKYREIGFESVGRFLDELEITMCEIMPYYNERFKTIEIMHDLPNPFDNVDFVEEYTEERTGQNEKETIGSASSSGETSSNDTGHSETTASDESNTTATVNHNNKSVHTTTPSDTVSIPAQSIDTVTHADEVTWNQDKNSDTGTTQGSSSGETDTTNEGHSESSATSENQIEEAGSHSETIHHKFTKVGNQGVNTYAHDMNEFRTSIIDVVYEIITDSRVADLFMKVY